MVWLNNLWAKMLVLRTRLSAYINIINTLMLFKLFWESFENKVFVMMLITGTLIVTSLIVAYDYFFIFGKESGITWERNLSFIKLKEQMDRIEKKLDEKNG